MPENKPSNKERMREITEGIEQGIKELFESEKYMRYLSVMSRFHRYSVNNTMLIYLQKPDATLVAGFNKWKNQFSRHVKKGERGITIIAPTPYKKKVEREKLDPDTRAPLLDEDGKVIMEEKTVEIPMFRPVKVFDLSQTDGKPLPHLADTLTGNVRHFEAYMEALRRAAPVPVTMEAMSADTDGYFSITDQRIAIRTGMSEVQTISATVHEIAHSKLHNPELAEAAAGWNVVMVSPGGVRHDHRQGFASEADATAAAEQEDWKFVDENGFEWALEIEEDRAAVVQRTRDHRTEEVQAESISYAVCQYYGIQTAGNSFGYIATWSKDKSLKELRASLEIINKTSCELITDIDRHYKEICKEQGIDLAAEQEQAAGQEVSAGPEAEQPAEAEAVAVVEAEQSTEPEAVAEPEPEQPAGAEQPAVQPKDTVLDEYPMPDDGYDLSDMEAHGYTDGDLLPVSRERAAELIEQDITVYAVAMDSTELVFDREEVEDYRVGTVFAVPKEEWEGSRDFRDAVAARMDRQQERETAFFDHAGDCFAIYQLRDADETRALRYQPLPGQGVDKKFYELVYTADLNVQDMGESTAATLENLFTRFNTEHPADYRHPSMSVSDIVALKQDGVVSCHYVDRFAFSELHGFLAGENPLKNAEMTVEDDHGMIDGIINNGPKEPIVAELEQQARSGQPISLLDLAMAIRREDSDQKKSVVEQLKNQPRPKHKKTAPKKSAEKEI